MKRSTSTIEGLTEQMVNDDYGQPKARWEGVTYRVCEVIGAVVILLVILNALGLRR